MKINLDDKIKARMLTLLKRYEEQVEIVVDDISDYMTGFNISKIQISKDVTDMKATFSQINAIMKELK